MESVESEEDRNIFNKWYELDAKASPMIYILQPVIKHYPDVASEDPAARKIATLHWKEEAEKMISILSNILPDGQKQKNLTSGIYFSFFYLIYKMIIHYLY